MDKALEDNLIALCRAFEALYPNAGFYFGHIVIQDHNFDADSVDWAIAHIDDTVSWNSARRNHPETTTEETNRWNEAAHHLLNLIKVAISP